MFLPDFLYRKILNNNVALKGLITAFGTQITKAGFGSLLLISLLGFEFVSKRGYKSSCYRVPYTECT